MHGFANSGLDLAQHAGIYVDEHDPGALLGKEPGRCGSDAASAAGDDCGLACQTWHGPGLLLGYGFSRPAWPWIRVCGHA